MTRPARSTTVSEMRVSGHLRTRHTASGPVYYAAWRDAAGKQHQRKLGPVWAKRGRPENGALTDKLAKEQLEEILADARRGTLEMRQRSGATFADAAAEFLRYIAERERERSTIADYKSVIDGYLLREFGRLPVEDITADMVDAYKHALIREGRLSNRTIVRHLTVLHGIFRRAKRVWGLRANPASAELVDRPSVTYSGEFQTLTPVEVLALAAAADDPQDGAIYLTAAFTGLRLGELVALRWRDVAFNVQRLQVRRNRPSNSRSEGEKTPKSGKVRSAPMVDEVMAALDQLSQRARWTGPDDLVFVNEAGEPVSGWTLRRHFYADLQRAGLGHLRAGEKPIVFHDLRHAFGTLGATVWELPKLQAYMGHGHVTTTMRYIHHSPAARDVDLLGGAIRRAGMVPETSVSVPPRYLEPVTDDGQNEESPTVAGLSAKARTGIEPVYTALQAAPRLIVSPHLQPKLDSN